MFDFPKSRAGVVASILGFAMVGLGTSAAATETKAAVKDSAHETPESYEPNAANKKPSKKKAASPIQKDKDFEHELVQSEGVNHPREIVSGPGATKKSPVKKSASAATQKDKDLEHELVQSDGVNHPREIVSGPGATKKSPVKKSASAATQKDKDLEHELVQSEGVNHPREVLKK